MVSRVLILGGTAEAGALARALAAGGRPHRSCRWPA